MASVQTIQTAIAEGKRVFVLAADGGYDVINSADAVAGFSQEQLDAVRIEKEVATSFIVGFVKKGQEPMTLDHNGLLTPELNAGKRYFERKARAMAKKQGMNAIIPITNPLVYDEEFGEISYPAVAGKPIKL